MNREPRLENWAFYIMTSNPYEAPESQRKGMMGEVFNREPRFEDGTRIYTSPVCKFVLEAGVPKQAVTKNTTYILGTPDPEFVAWMDKEGHTFQKYADAVQK